MQKQISIAKISRPRLSQVLLRRRLFNLLDKGLDVPVTWLSGPGGSGKTTLAASWLDAGKHPCLWYQLDESDGDIATFFYYLGLAAKKAAPRYKTSLPLFTPEYTQGIPAFTRRYFESLYARLNSPGPSSAKTGRKRFVIVLDNYHLVASGSPFHDVIREGLSVLPEGIMVLIISRGAPPPSLALLTAYNKIHFIGSDALKFDMSETRELVGAVRKAELDEISGQLLGVTEGWAAGLVLLTERLRTLGIMPGEHACFKSGELFDYFATEIFEKTDAAMQAFLLRTAVLPRMSSGAAAELSNRKDAGALLAALSRNHFFTERRSVSDPVYQYHPLFREFLLSRARETYSRDEMRGLMRCAAALLERAGQIEEAAELYQQAEEWDLFVNLILSKAGPMVSQGRTRSLEQWIGSLPEKTLEQDPWLLYWKGMCRMPYSLQESRGCLEWAFLGFRERKDAAGLYSSWAGIVETFVYEWGDFSPLDHWISEFEGLRLEHPAFPSAEIATRTSLGIFCALMYRQTHHPDLPLWEIRVRELVLGSSDSRLRFTLSSQLILYYALWTGDLAKALAVIDALKPSVRSRGTDPLQVIIWHAISAAYYWLRADYEQSMKAVTDGLRTAEETGINLENFIFYCVGSKINVTWGKPEHARRFLDLHRTKTTPASGANRAAFSYTEAFFYLSVGDSALAIETARMAQEFALLSGAPLFISHSLSMLGVSLLASDNREEGLAVLARARETALAANIRTAEFLSLISEAWYFLRKGEDNPGLEALAGAFAIGREQGLTGCMWNPFMMAFLCAQALEHRIEPEYARSLIWKRALVPPENSFELEEWPWPMRISTLGRFEIIVDGEPLRFPGKVKKKPIEMLKVLIAFGGQDVPEARITDALWPEAEGDMARRSFDTTLHRLRKLLGNDTFIQHRDGCLSLNRSCCSLDVWSFERLAERIESKRHDAGAVLKPETGVAPYPDLNRIAKAIMLYKGEFLHADARDSWALPMRDRLRTKFKRLVMAQGGHWEKSELFDKAADCYRGGLETDSLAEEFYQRFMICCVRLGQQAEAAKAYLRCKTMLLKSLGLAPSSKTEEIYRSLRTEQVDAAIDL